MDFKQDATLHGTTPHLGIENEAYWSLCLCFILNSHMRSCTMQSSVLFEVHHWTVQVSSALYICVFPLVHHYLVKHDVKHEQSRVQQQLLEAP